MISVLKKLFENVKIQSEDRLNMEPPYSVIKCGNYLREVNKFFKMLQQDKNDASDSKIKCTISPAKKKKTTEVGLIKSA